MTVHGAQRGRGGGELALVSGIAFGAVVGALVLQQRRARPDSTPRAVPSPVEQAEAPLQPAKLSEPQPTESLRAWLPVAVLAVLAIAAVTLLGPLGWWLVLLPPLVHNAQVPLALLGLAAVLLAHQVIGQSLAN